MPTAPDAEAAPAAGKALRAEAPLDSHATVARTAASPDPLTLLEEQAATRVPELVPIRYGRMIASPFAFYRGAAAGHGRRPRRTAPRSGLCRPAVR